MTGETQYAKESFDYIDLFLTQNSLTDKIIVDHFPSITYISRWLKQGLSQSDYQRLDSLINQMAQRLTNTPPVSHSVQSANVEQAMASYIGLVQYAVLLKSSNQSKFEDIINFIPVGAEKPSLLFPQIGGLTPSKQEIGANLRNTLGYFAKMAEGGEFIDSSERNANIIVPALFMLQEMDLELDQQNFLDFTDQIKELAKISLLKLTPDLQSVYEWGFNDGQLTYMERLHSVITEWTYYAFMMQDLNRNLAKNLYWLVDNYLQRIPDISKINQYFWLFYDPYFQRKSYSSFEHGNASGQGIAFFNQYKQSGVQFVSHFFANNDIINKYNGSMSTFKLYKGGRWILDNPSINDSVTAYTSNAMIVKGYPTTPKEAKGQVAFISGQNYIFHVGCSGGQLEKGQQNFPQQFYNENTRQVLFLSEDDKSETIIIYDRINAVNPSAQLDYQNYPQQIKQHLEFNSFKNIFNLQISLNNTSDNKNTFSWNSHSSALKLETLLPTEYDFSILDLKSLTANNFISPAVDQSELGHSLQIKSRQDKSFETFLNVLRVDNKDLQSKLIQSSDFEKVEGVYYIANQKCTMVLFCAEKREDISPTPDIGGFTSFSDNKLQQIARLRFFQSQFSINYQFNILTQLYIADLNPSKIWKMKYGKEIISLSVDLSGLSYIEIQPSDIQTINIYSE